MSMGVARETVDGALPAFAAAFASAQGKDVTARAVSVDDFEALARERLPPDVWAYLSAGGADEITLAKNRTAFDAVAVTPRVLRDTSTVPTRRASCSARPLALPVFARAHRAAPSLVRRRRARRRARGRGERDRVRAEHDGEPAESPRSGAACAADVGCRSTSSATAAKTLELVARAEDAGATALVLSPSTRRARRRAIASIAHRRCSPRRAPGEPRTGAETWGKERGATRCRFETLLDPSVHVERSAVARAYTRLPIVTQRASGPPEGRRASASSTAPREIIVSNHGGRNLDTARRRIEALPRVAAARSRASALPVCSIAACGAGTDIGQGSSRSAPTRCSSAGRISTALAHAGEQGVRDVPQRSSATSSSPRCACAACARFPRFDRDVVWHTWRGNHDHRSVHVPSPRGCRRPRWSPDSTASMRSSAKRASSQGAYASAVPGALGRAEHTLYSIPRPTSSTRRSTRAPTSCGSRSPREAARARRRGRRGGPAVARRAARRFSALLEISHSTARHRCSHASAARARRPRAAVMGEELVRDVATGSPASSPASRCAARAMTSPRSRTRSPRSSKARATTICARVPRSPRDLDRERRRAVGPRLLARGVRAAQLPLRHVVVERRRTTRSARTCRSRALGHRGRRARPRAPADAGITGKPVEVRRPLELDTGHADEWLDIANAVHHTNEDRGPRVVGARMQLDVRWRMLRRDRPGRVRAALRAARDTVAAWPPQGKVWAVRRSSSPPCPRSGRASVGDSKLVPTLRFKRVLHPRAATSTISRRTSRISVGSRPTRASAG